MQIIDNKALLLRVKDPAKITAVVPESEQVGAHDVLVKWTLEVAQVLKNLGLKRVPSPIRTKYNWPGIYRPFDHQRGTAEFLTLHRRAYCFSEQGTGKTASVVWAADYLMTRKQIRRVLIICPLTVMSPTWRNDIFQTAMHRTVGIAHNADRDRRRRVIRGEDEFVVINYDGVEIVAKDILEDGRFDLVVLDEANLIKTHTTDRWKTINTIIKPSTWVWMLTGTPASQSPVDAYGLARMMASREVPKFFGSFRDTVMNKITKFKWAPKPGASAIVHKLLQPAIRHTKAECLDLPEMLYTTREVPMTPQQSKYYEQMRKQMAMDIGGEEITAVNAAAMLTKLLQISNGTIYTDSRGTVEFNADTRVKALEEIINEAEKKVLVFVPFRNAITFVTERLIKDGYTVDVIHGGVSATQRTEIIRRFQSEADPRVLVIQPQAASHGITLHAANVVVYWGPVMSVETYLQANARVHRAGQTNKTLVVHLQGSPVERKVYRMLGTKVDTHEQLIDLYSDVLKEEPIAN